MLITYSRYADVDISSLLKIYGQSDRPWDWQEEAAFMDDLQLFFQCRQVFLAQWVENGAPVAAMRVERYRDGYLISCLETAPAHRRMGYASYLLRSVFEKYPGAYYSHIDRRNRASLALHKKLGFDIISDFAVHVDGSVYANSFTLKRTGV